VRWGSFIHNCDPTSWEISTRRGSFMYVMLPELWKMGAQGRILCGSLVMEVGDKSTCQVDYNVVMKGGNVSLSIHSSTTLLSKKSLCRCYPVIKSYSFSPYHVTHVCNAKGKFPPSHLAISYTPLPINHRIETPPTVIELTQIPLQKV